MASIAIHSSQTLTFSQAEAQALNAPTGGANYYVCVYNTEISGNDATLGYLIAPGSEDTNSALVCPPQQTVQFGPFQNENILQDTPEIYSNGSGTFFVTFLVIRSGR